LRAALGRVGPRRIELARVAGIATLARQIIVARVYDARVATVGARWRPSGRHCWRRTNSNGATITYSLLFSTSTTTRSARPIDL